MVASLRPTLVRLDNPVIRELVRLLDGSRDRTALLRDLATAMRGVEVPSADGGKETHPVAWWLEQLASTLETGLRDAARMGLLAH